MKQLYERLRENRRRHRQMAQELNLWLNDVFNGATLKDEMGNIRIWPDKLLDLLHLRSKVTRYHKRIEMLEFLMRYPYPPASTLEEVDRRIELWHNAKDGVQKIELHEYLGWTWNQYCFWVRTNQVPRFKGYL